MPFQYPNVLVTGASRGIGLELVRQLSKRDGINNLFATYRSASIPDELQKLVTSSNGVVKPLSLDVTNHKSYPSIREQVFEHVGSVGLNLLVNNAGIYIKNTFENISTSEMLETYEVNVVAPLLFTRELLPLLKDSATAGHKTLVANISSQYGSIAQNDHKEAISYRASKAALNMVTKSLSNRFKEENIIVIPYHPGWAQTDMGGAHAAVTVFDSANGLIEQFEKAELANAGVLTRYDGLTLPY